MPASTIARARCDARAAALELDRVAAGLLDEPLGGRDRLLVGGLVGAERQVADEQRRRAAAADGRGEHQHLVGRDRHGRGVAEHGHRAGVADEHDVDAGLLGDLGRRVVVGGDHHDRLAEALLLGEPRERHRQRRVEAVRDGGAWCGRHRLCPPLRGGWRPEQGRHLAVDGDDLVLCADVDDAGVVVLELVRVVCRRRRSR